jgi:hypothetical protein
VLEKHGFDVFLGYYDQVHAHSYYPAYILRNSKEVPLKGNSGDSAGTSVEKATFKKQKQSQEFKYAKVQTVT